jgi:FlaA1/EpsC-like NDP-sugar epimerase
MIRLSGLRGVEIVETGLRPGEKLYEELLIHTEELDRTGNSMIFIERDRPVPMEELEQKLATLQRACASGDDDAVREALKSVVPTYKSPEEVNRAGIAATEYAVKTTEDGLENGQLPLAGRPGVVT